MAGNVNKVFLMGNLTRDIEVRQAGASNVAKLGLAINRVFKTSSGEKREETTFVDCEAWGGTGEVMARYLSKGSPVFVEGRLKLDQWQDQQGNNRSKLKVVVESFEFVDSKGGGGGGGGGGGNYGNAGTGDQDSGQSQGNYQPVTDDEIPF